MEEIVYILSNVSQWKLNQIAVLPAENGSASVLKNLHTAWHKFHFKEFILEKWA